MRLLPFLLAVLLSLAGTMSKANNIQVANAVLTGNTGTTTQIQFDLSWENSWRLGSGRWDAAWVFVKYRTSLTGPWYHANVNNTGHVAAAGSQIDLGLLTPGTAYNASSNPVMGVFVYRNAAGTGNLSLPSTQLQWAFAAQGLDISDIAQVQVFAIEMVYVPQGAFAAGSGGSEVSAFTLTTINTANATTVPAGTGSLGGQAGGFPTGQTAPASATWPNGFNAFYCMKYEVTQQGYVDFLNTLTYTQQVTRTASVPTSLAGTSALITGYANTRRNGIRIQTPGVASTTPAVYACDLYGFGVYDGAVDGRDIACNFLSWGDLTAYLYWSGLRPMTELEFEKACRGTIAPVANEYPWGTTGIAASGAYTLDAYGATNEGIATNYSTTLGNAVYNFTLFGGAINGPLRVGIFAANGSNSGRVTAGASYYGIMELGGNLWERAVTIGNVEGRAFTGLHGNGALAADGNPDGAAWPAPTSAIGSGLRGGAWYDNAYLMQVSCRIFAANTNNDRFENYGGRGARLAP
jgi:formylglycine-generating enzyme required for sulfatase activity